MNKILVISILCFFWSNVVLAKIVIPVHSWTTQIVMAYVIGGIFENMGHPVQYVTEDSQMVYKKISKGEDPIKKIPGSIMSYIRRNNLYKKYE